jgi:hypothetical protein
MQTSNACTSCIGRSANPGKHLRSEFLQTGTLWCVRYFTANEQFTRRDVFALDAFNEFLNRVAPRFFIVFETVLNL